MKWTAVDCIKRNPVWTQGFKKSKYGKQLLRCGFQSSADFTPVEFYGICTIILLDVVEDFICPPGVECSRDNDFSWEGLPVLLPGDRHLLVIEPGLHHKRLPDFLAIFHDAVNRNGRVVVFPGVIVLELIILDELSDCHMGGLLGFIFPSYGLGRFQMVVGEIVGVLYDGEIFFSLLEVRVPGVGYHYNTVIEISVTCLCKSSFEVSVIVSHNLVVFVVSNVVFF